MFLGCILASSISKALDIKPTSAIWLLLGSSHLSYKLNSLPRPSTDLAQTLPFMLSAIRLQILRPMPVPFGFKFLLALSIVNGAKSFFWSCVLIPHPESLTVIVSRPILGTRVFFLNAKTTLMVPFDVNFIALPM